MKAEITPTSDPRARRQGEPTGGRALERKHFAGLFGFFLVLFFTATAMLGYGADHHIDGLIAAMLVVMFLAFVAGILALTGLITPRTVNQIWDRSKPPDGALDGAGPPYLPPPPGWSSREPEQQPSANDGAFRQIERRTVPADERSFPALETLGEDLILLSPLHKSGFMNTPSRLRYGLMGSELVRLVAGGYVEIVKGKIERLDVPRAPTDPNLDEAINSIRKSPKAKSWVAQTRLGIVDTYLHQLEAKGVVRSETSKSLKVFTTTRWYIADEGRSAAVRRRLDDIAAGPQGLGIEDRSLAGLAYAIGLGAVLYPGREGKLRRKTLQQIARPRKPGLFSRRSNAAPEPTDVATSASLDAAHQAAIDAAVQAAIDQAIGAAVDAAIDVAIDAGSGGGDGGGHHG